MNNNDDYSDKNDDDDDDNDDNENNYEGNDDEDDDDSDDEDNDHLTPAPLTLLLPDRPTIQPTTHLSARLPVCPSIYFPFSDATTHLCKRSCPSVRP